MWRYNCGRAGRWQRLRGRCRDRRGRRGNGVGGGSRRWDGWCWRRLQRRRGCRCGGDGCGSSGRHQTRGPIARRRAVGGPGRARRGRASYAAAGRSMRSRHSGGCKRGRWRRSAGRSDGRALPREERREDAWRAEGRGCPRRRCRRRRGDRGVAGGHAGRRRGRRRGLAGAQGSCQPSVLLEAPLLLQPSLCQQLLLQLAGNLRVLFLLLPPAPLLFDPPLVNRRRLLLLLLLLRSLLCGLLRGLRLLLWLRRRRWRLRLWLQPCEGGGGGLLRLLHQPMLALVLSKGSHDGSNLRRKRRQWAFSFWRRIRHTLWRLVCRLDFAPQLPVPCRPARPVPPAFGHCTGAAAAAA